MIVRESAAHKPEAPAKGGGEPNAFASGLYSNIAHGQLEHIEPEMGPAVPALRLPPFVTPVRFPERRVGHVGRWPHVGRTGRFGPFRALGRPVVVREVVVGIMVEAVRVEALRTGRAGSSTPGCHQQ